MVFGNDIGYMIYDHLPELNMETDTIYKTEAVGMARTYQIPQMHKFSSNERKLRYKDPLLNLVSINLSTETTETAA